MAHRVTEMERPSALDDDGVLEHDVAADEFPEVADAVPNRTGTWLTQNLVDEAEVQRLLDDVGAGDRDELVGGDPPSPS